MQLQSSYIFLPNPYKKEDSTSVKQDNVIRVKTENSELQSKAKGVINIDTKTDKNKIKSIYNASSREFEKIARWQRFFYSFEFSDIQKLLFSKSWTSIDEQAQASFLDKNQDLSQLSDETLRDAFYKYTPKSDWERFFSNKIPELDVEEIIEEIRRSRNNIAHCKFFYKAEYESCNGAISCLNKAVVSAIKIAEEKDFSDKNSEYIANAMAGVIERIGTYTQKISDTFRPALQAMGKIAESLNHYFDVFQKCDFSSVIRAFEVLSIAPTSSNDDSTIEEMVDNSDEDENNRDELSQE